MLLALELVVLTIFVLLVSILYSKLASFSIKCDILRSGTLFYHKFHIVLSHVVYCTCSTVISIIM